MERICLLLIWSRVTISEKHLNDTSLALLHGIYDSYLWVLRLCKPLWVDFDRSPAPVTMVCQIGKFCKNWSGAMDAKALQKYTLYTWFLVICALCQWIWCNLIHEMLLQQQNISCRMVCNVYNIIGGQCFLLVKNNTRIIFLLSYS